MVLLQRSQGICENGAKQGLRKSKKTKEKTVPENWRWVNVPLVVIKEMSSACLLGRLMTNS